MAEQSGSPSSIISLPKGGGAMHGMGEKFSPDLFTGTGNFTVPITLPPGRNGFQPQLNLVYSTGQGNSSFGYGWGLSIPGVARQTAKGIPQYDEQEDVFVLSGAEDLVPIEHHDKTHKLGAHTLYRPRTEGLFAQIRYFRDPKNAYWEVKTKDGLTSIYGTPNTFGQVDGGESGTCIDPSDPSKIFAWRLTKTNDPFQNLIRYTYARDTAEDGGRHWDQLYLTKVEYVNLDTGKFLVSVDFEYDKERPDAFSEYKAGFEIRTRWRCKEILISTNPAENTQVKVRRYHFSYDNSSINRASLLSAVRVSGFDDAGNEQFEMPPLEFHYGGFDPVLKRDFFPVAGDDLPAVALSNPDFELADLTGNGLPDVFQLNRVARFWKNLGNGRYDLPKSIKERPPVALSDQGVQMMDADGDGRIDLMVTDGAFSGYYSMEHGHQANWDRRSFKKFKTAPSFNLKDPEVKLIDLTGDGVTDVLRSGTRFECFFFHPQEGWHKTRFWPRQSDLAVFPNVQFSDSRVKWADMSGDTMQDLVLVHDGNVEYYPNRGYGRFGKRVHMHNSPSFPFGYDPRRILLGDVDGDGLADLIYVDDRQVFLWINQSGNGWSKDPIVIPGTPPMTDQDSVRIIDLKGTGVGGILWSQALRGDGRPHLFFLDFTAGNKPYVLQEMNNNIGSSTKVSYTSSADFYLLDEKERRHRWQTSLPFPVQVVQTVEVIDHISKTKLSTRYRYHHGYWDGLEREFRGFGMVEQTDTLSEIEYNTNGLHGDLPFKKVEKKQFAPPLHTKTWFHQGAIREVGNSWYEADYSAEYWEGDPGFWDKGQFLADLLRGSGLKPHEKRDALRALRGSILRTELYALDGSNLQENPYTVTESRYDVTEKFPPSEAEIKKGRKRIFFPHALSQRTTQWERGDEPLTQFVFTADYDEFGRPGQQTQIACYRGWQNLDDRGGEFLATRSRTYYAQPVDDEVYIHDRVAGVKHWEIQGTRGMNLAEVVQLKDGQSMELFAHTLNFYDGAAYTGRQWGEVEAFGAQVRSENLVLTDDILQKAYSKTLYSGQNPIYFKSGQAIGWTPEYPLDFQQSAKDLGYHFHNGRGKVYEKGYYVQAERKQYDFQAGTGNVGLPIAVLGPLADTSAGEPNAHKTIIEYDAYDLLPVKAVQVMSNPPAGTQGLEMRAVHNYRVMQAQEVYDPNGNKSKFEYSPLGLLVASWLQGQAGKNEGDQQRPSTRLDYNFLNFQLSGGAKPIWVRTVKQIHHDRETDVLEPQRSETITSVEYSDGFGRVVQTRTQAEEEIFGEPIFGGKLLSPDQNDEAGSKAPISGVLNTNSDAPNVVVSGWQIYDNKGQVIEKYEPFFDRGWDYQPPTEAQMGKSIRMAYDPRGQVIKTLNPDGSQQWVIYGRPRTLDTPQDYIPTPWEAYTYDANDLAPLSEDPAGHTLKQQAPVEHHFTPSQVEIDALGRVIKTVQRLTQSNHPNELIQTHTAYDIQGNVVKIVDALGREAFLHAYDLAKRPLLIESIDAGDRCNIYDAAGNLIERRDLRGALILQTYDELNRPTLKWAANGGGQAPTLRERMVYGENAHQAQANNLLGKLYEQYDEAGVVKMAAYDFKGNVLEQSRQVVHDTVLLRAMSNASVFVMDWAQAPQLSAPFNTSMAYDALNRVKSMTYPQDVNGDRKVLQPLYNRAGALEKVTLDGQTYVERLAYNAKGQRTLIVYGNQLMTRYTYDPLTFRLLRLRTEKFIQPDASTYEPQGAAVQDFGYQYDLVGNIHSIRDVTKGSGVPKTQLGANELQRNFSYDAIYRLRSATGRECDTAPPATGNSQIDEWLQMGYCDDASLTRKYTQKYTYDKMGNMTQLQHSARGGSYNKDLVTQAGNNRLQSATFRGQTFKYQYDQNGNLAQEAKSRYMEWDHSDRLVRFRVQAAAGPASIQTAYVYDAGGMRVKKLTRKMGGDWESRSYIGGLFEYTCNSTGDENNHSHIMDEQSRIAVLRVGHTMGDTWPAVQYHLGDHLGSSNVVRGGVDASANGAIGREEYYPYGSTSFGAYAKKRYRYSGKEKDEESGLYYYGARYYAGLLGRWCSCDPIGCSDSVNIYLYLLCNPIILTDSVGYKSSEKEFVNIQVINSTYEDDEAYFFADEYLVQYKDGEQISYDYYREVHMIAKGSNSNELQLIESFSQHLDKKGNSEVQLADVEVQSEVNQQEKEKDYQWYHILWDAIKMVPEMNKKTSAERQEITTNAFENSGYTRQESEILAERVMSTARNVGYSIGTVGATGLTKLGSNAGKTYQVYVLVGQSSNKVRYVGITSRNYFARFLEHLRKKSPIWQRLKSYPVPSPLLTKTEARILEQRLINDYKDQYGKLLNRRNEIIESLWKILGI